MTRYLLLSLAVLSTAVANPTATPRPNIIWVVSEDNNPWLGCYGEPTLLGVEFFRNAVALQARYAQGKTIENALQTHGVLLDDEWGAFFAQQRFLFGISIDGPSHLHDAYRVDKGGKPTFDQVMAGLQVLKRHGVEFNTLTDIMRLPRSHWLSAVVRFNS